METDLQKKIAENAKQPKRAQGDIGSVEQHSLPDQIAADRYRESSSASRKKGLGVKTVKLVPPGAV